MIFRIIMRTICSQWNRSRNAEERALKKCQRAFWASVYLLKGILIAVKSLNREQLGSEVEFQGKRCFISNWAGSENPTLASTDGFYQKAVPRADIKSLKGPRELIHRFRTGLGFYLSNWHSIDVSKRIYK